VLFENISSPQTIFARVENTLNSDCFDTTFFDVNVLLSPSSEDETLYICTNESIILNAEEGFDYYNWSTGETTQSITVDLAGIYTVEIQNVYNVFPNEVICARDKVFTVIESDEATITAIEINDWTDSSNTISVFVEGIGDYEFSLDNVNYQDSNVFNNLQSGDYVVYVRDKNNCGIVTEEVFLIHYPKFFTPNGDSDNPYWQIEFSNTEPDLEISIYNRYGKLLKKLSPNSVGWDGTYNGKEMPTSDYWFIVVRPSNGKTYSGHFTLKR
jgi:gliding motility-associated-like protein